MEFIAVAFRSRAETVKFYEYATSYGVNAEIINTPKEAGVGCGFSVKVKDLPISVLKRAVFSFNAKTFAGIFIVKSVGGRRFVKGV